MKNGFTLIELLAVIVILAIIALIAVPIVLNIINDSKESSLLRSAEFYLSAVEYTIADAFLYHGGLEDKEYPITPTGDICKKALPCDDDNTLKVEVNGDKPTGGSITIDSGNISDVALILDERTIVKNSKGELVYLKYLDDVCTLVSGTAKTAGAKYECKVNPNKDAYTFYVLTTPSATDTSINLIMDRNICSDGNAATEDNTCYVAWISEEEYYKDTGGNIPNEILNDNGVCQHLGVCVFNDKGPITAMNYIYVATKSWTNTNEILVDKFDNDAGSKFDMQSYNAYARLPYYSEVGDFNNNNGYLYENLDGRYWDYDESPQPTNNIENIEGYWVLSSNVSDSNFAINMRFDGNMTSDRVDYVGYGVRPVITLNLKN